MNRCIPILLLLCLAIPWAGCSKPPAKSDPIRPVRAVKIGDVDALSGRSLPGRARPAQEVNLSFRVPGPLMQLPVSVGDQVKTGDILAQIDPTDFRVAVRDAEASLERAQRNLEAMQMARPEEIRVAQEEVNSRRASLARAKADHDRSIELLEGNAIAQREFDVSLNLLRVAEANLEAAQQQLEQAQAGARLEDIDAQKAEIRSLDANLENAKNQLTYTTLKAPFDGTISATFVENFEKVQSGQLIVRLIDKTRIEFTVNIPESSISLVSFVRDITCIFDAFPDHPFSAAITEVGSEASQTTRTFPVTIVMSQQYADEGITILPGMAGRATGRIEIPEGSLQAGIEIPATALFVDGEQTFVWVVDESTNTVQRQAVTKGELTAHGVMVPELRPGQWIATAGVHSLTEGQQVRIVGQ